MDREKWPQSSLSISNGLSFLRGPLAFLFLYENPWTRVSAVLLAMLTDSVDGYFARRRRSVSQFGAILDPAMDKFFVFFALVIFCLDGKLRIWQACALLARDLFIAVFGIYLQISKKWTHFTFRAIRWGKMTTALQFLLLIGLALGISFPPAIFLLFVLLGLLSFLELMQLAHSTSSAD